MHSNKQDVYEEAGGVYLPTQEEIKAACKEIQKGWSEDERLRRTRGPGKRPALPPKTAKLFKLFKRGRYSGLEEIDE